MIRKVTLGFTMTLLVGLSSPAHAFWGELVEGMTSVTNNLIDSSENVANHTIDATALTIVTLSNDTGKMADRIGLMADRIGVMADRIGFMADRIVTTEGLLAGIAHKAMDHHAGSAVRVAQTSADSPARPGQVRVADTSRYSASQMILGVGGSTYTATTPAAQGYQPGVNPWLASRGPQQLPTRGCGYRESEAIKC